jgi:biopolymer transport protein ExbD/biopolymer transport protein TolR
MAFDIGSGKKRKPDINVTPLVDVVLVLLIIFLIVTPLLMREFWTHLPKQEQKKVEQKTTSSDKQLVLQILPEDKLKVNKAEIPLNALSERLKRMFAARDNHVLFVDIKDEANYGFAVQAMDQARAGGAVSIAMLAKPLGKK